MKIVIDADGCPVVDITVRLAEEFQLECFTVCDTSHYFADGYSKTIVVSKGRDSADFKIVNLINKNDIVITQDYGLAAMCLSKDAVVLNQNGFVYSSENIDNLLFSRHISKVQRIAGQHLKGPKKRTGEQDKSFEAALRKILSSN